jgi:transglutaminase-like putative cysteine protease
MILKITHTTTYSYSRPVLLDPQVIRLRPRCDGSQRLIRFAQQIRPEPVGASDFSDLDGNAATAVWFDAPVETMTVTMDSQVETLRSNPYHFIVTESSLLGLPVRYSDELEMSLAGYCRPQNANSPVAELADLVAQECGGRTVEFLAQLARRIQALCQSITREEGPPRDPEQTLHLRAGSCRDLAVVYMEACRSMGLAARFASGYMFSPNGSPHRRALHAWAEVYLPGGGWRGFDPTLGMAVADQHVPLAASPLPSGAAPITGSYWGRDVTTSMKAHVHVEAL